LAAEVLSSFGADLSTVRSEVIRHLSNLESTTDEKHEEPTVKPQLTVAPVGGVSAQLMRVDSFRADPGRLDLARSAIEPLLSEIDRFASANTISAENRDRLDSDRRVLHEMLRHPSPPPIVVEATVADVMQVLAEEGVVSRELSVRLRSEGVSADPADRVASQVQGLVEAAGRLNADESDGGLSDAISRLADLGEELSQVNSGAEADADPSSSAPATRADREARIENATRRLIADVMPTMAICSTTGLLLGGVLGSVVGSLAGLLIALVSRKGVARG
jgi:hypothetical protein